MDPLVAFNTSLYAKKPYAYRAELLRERILPAACSEGWDEIIVVGQFEAGIGYEYVPMQPIFRDRRDALWQREAGARCSTGSILAFGHDDHMFAPGALEMLCGVPDDWDILVPARHNEAGDTLDNGKKKDYMGGHCLFMRRAAWAKVPWTTVDTEWWDVTLTRVWREEGLCIQWTDKIVHIDLDA
jgi:hypothetical protein